MKTAPPPRALSGVERYLPLTDATVFAYEARSADSAPGMLVLEVRRTRPESAALVVAGRITLLEVDASGIRHATGGWLLKEPLALGAKWQGDFGTVEVTALDRAVRVPAGDFKGCVETVEASVNQAFVKRTTTVYCPDVGIVTRRTEAESEEGAGVESLALKSYGARFDLEKSQ